MGAERAIRPSWGGRNYTPWWQCEAQCCSEGLRSATNKAEPVRGGGGGGGRGRGGGEGGGGGGEGGGG